MKKFLSIILVLIGFSAFAQPSNSSQYQPQPARWKMTKPLWLDSGMYVKNIQKMSNQEQFFVRDSVTGKFGYRHVSASGGSSYSAGNGLTLGGTTFYVDSTKIPTLNKTNVFTSNSSASKSSVRYTGTVFTGGTSTTTKPFFLIEPTGTSSTTWNVLGTAIGTNLQSGYIGNQIDLKLNNLSVFTVTYEGGLQIGASFLLPAASPIRWSGQSRLYSPNDGIIRFTNDANNDFDMLQFGLTTNARGAIKVNGNKLVARLADNSGNTNFQVKDTVYSSAWNGSIDVPTKNAVYDKIESLPSVAGLAYTPTVTGLSNTSSVTANNFQYSRTGSTVTVSGNFAMTVTTTMTATTVSISLPIPSNFSNVGDCGGTGCANSYDACGHVFADVSTDIATFECTPVLTGSRNISVHFTYIIK